MPPSPESAIREALDEQLAESLEAPIPPRTERKVPGTLQVVGKITAVVGMRRVGKTTSCTSRAGSASRPVCRRRGSPSSTSRTSVWPA